MASITNIALGSRLPMALDSALIESIFSRAVDQHAAAEQRTFLDHACRDDVAVRRRVERLISVHGRVGDFLEVPLLQLMSPELLHERLASELTEDADRDPTDGWRTNACDELEVNFLALRSPDQPGCFGPFEAVTVLGRGAMGLVLRAYEPDLQRFVAVKVLLPVLAANPTARRRFLREARAAAAVNHDHVVTVHRIGEARGLPYLVMELIDGMSLQRKLSGPASLPVDEILRIGREIAAGLAAAHQRGLVHRDIKPANILLKRDNGRALITDFGLAKAVDDVTITGAAIIAGTPQYMSPEQVQGQAVDHRSDLFSFGCVLYAMCAGQPPFSAESTAGVLEQIRSLSPRPIRELRTDIPDALAEIIHRLLQKDPNRRLASAAEASTLLEQCQTRRHAPATDAAATSVPAGRFPLWRLIISAGGLAVLVALALAANRLDWWHAPAMTEGSPMTGGSNEDRMAVSPDSDPGEAAAMAASARKTVPKLETTIPSLEPGPLMSGARSWLDTGGDESSSLYGEVARFDVSGDLQALAISPGGRTVYAGGVDGAVRVWDLVTGEELPRWIAHERPVLNLAVSPTGDLVASCAGDRSLIVWDARFGTQLARKLLPAPVRRLAFAPDGQSILICLTPHRGVPATAGKPDDVALDAAALHLFDAATLAYQRSLRIDQTTDYWSLAWSPDGRHVAAGTYDGWVCRFQMDGDTMVHRFDCYRAFRDAPRFDRQGQPVHVVAFSANGRFVYSGDNMGGVWRWPVAGVEGVMVGRFRSGVRELALSRDATWLLAAVGLEVCLLDSLEIGERAIVRLPGHTGPVQCVAMLPDERHAVSCGRDGTIRLWRLPPLPRE